MLFCDVRGSTSMAEQMELRIAEMERTFNEHVRAGLRTEPVRDRLALIFVKAASIASINTLLHWGWIKDERLVKIGQEIIDSCDDSDEPASDEQSGDA